MADYYPLIARAVAGLAKNTGDARRALYERAREALVAQLRGVTPALDESDVTRERLALEEAIRKVEGESARQSSTRTESTNRVKAPEFPRWQERESEPEPEPKPELGAEPELDHEHHAEAEPEPQVPSRRVQAPPRQDGRPSSPFGRSRSERLTAESREGAPERGEPRRQAMPQRQERQEPRQDRPERPERHNGRPERQDGLAAARGRPESRRGYTEPDYNEADAGEREAVPPRNASRPRVERGDRGERRSLNNSGFREFRDVVSEADELGGASAKAKQSAKEKLAAVPNPKPRPRPRDADSDEAYLTLDDIAEPVMLEPSFVVDESRPIPPRASRQARQDEIGREGTQRRSYADLIRIAAALAVVGLIGSLLIWQWPNMVAVYTKLTTPAPPETQADTTPAPPPHKDPGRIEPGGKPQQDVANVAQRGVLYEEDPSDPGGKTASGSVVWSTETVSPGSGKPPELQVRANIVIPDRGLSVTWVLHRDTEPNSSSSHTIEVNFNVPSNFPSGGVSNVPGIWMTQDEQVQAQVNSLDGISVKVTTNYFLIGLSAVAAARDLNMKLLREKPWIEIPIVYINNRRAILAIEKGPPGDKVFADAFAAWGK